MKLLKIKWRVPILILLSLLLMHRDLHGQPSRMKGEQPTILKAVAPEFFPFVFNKTGSAEVEIEAKVNSDGIVVAARTTHYTVFTDLSVEKTAKAWVFEKSTTRKERLVRIKFIFRILPRETDPLDLVTIFRFPAEVEVRSPIIDSPKTSFPLPIREPDGSTP